MIKLEIYYYIYICKTKVDVRSSNWCSNQMSQKRIRNRRLMCAHLIDVYLLFSNRRQGLAFFNRSTSVFRTCRKRYRQIIRRIEDKHNWHLFKNVASNWTSIRRTQVDFSLTYIIIWVLFIYNTKNDQWRSKRR